MYEEAQQTDKEWKSTDKKQRIKMILIKRDYLY
jgi:hypothetical protein